MRLAVAVSILALALGAGGVALAAAVGLIDASGPKGPARQEERAASATPDVYWGGVYGDFIGKLAGRPEVRFVDGETVLGMTTAGTWLYWTCNCQPSHVGRAHIGPGPARVQRGLVEPQNGDASLEDVAEGDGYLYWVSEPSEGVTAVGRSRDDGTDVDESYLTLPDPDDTGQVESIAVQGGFIYWGADGSIGRSRLDGNELDPDFIPDAAAGDIAVNDRYIFWIGDGGVSRADLSGGHRIDRVVARHDLESLAADARHLYWARGSSTSDRSGGLIGRSGLDGTGARTLASGPKVGMEGSMRIAVGSG